jgi:hypothetical protein
MTITPMTERRIHLNYKFNNQVTHTNSRRGAKTASEDEIVQRLVSALANECRNILLDGVAARALDIDIVYLKG